MLMMGMAKIKLVRINMKDSILCSNNGVFRYLGGRPFSVICRKTFSSFLSKLVFSVKPQNDNEYSDVLKNKKIIHENIINTHHDTPSDIKKLSDDLSRASESIDVVELIKYEIEKQKKFYYTDKGSRIEFDCDFKECVVNFTKEHMKFVVSNLIDNAMRHSGEKLVVVSLRFVSDSRLAKYTKYGGNNFRESLSRGQYNCDRVYITVRDYGVGIEKKLAHLSFNKRKKSVLEDEIISRKEGVNAFDKMSSSGFSLSVIKKIMQLHETTIWTRNNFDIDVNCGAVFEFCLPIEKKSL